MNERRKEILRLLQNRGKVRVTELSRELGCSEVTIRSDMKAMEAEGLLKRTHGGAEQPEAIVPRKYSSETVYRNVEQKQQIAKAAYEYIEDRDTIVIDDASTCLYLARHIKNHPEKRIAVVTNSLLTGSELAGSAHVELFMIGGYVSGHLAATMGDEAIRNLGQFEVDKAFIGVHGINFDVGLTSIASPQMQVKKTIMRIAGRVFVLADSSKFGGGYLSVICPTNDVYRIITDSGISEENRAKARERNVPLVIA